MTRVFLSHSSRDSVQAIALARWLGEQRPGLAEDIFLDLDERAGIPQGVRWRDALRRAITRCEAVICLTSRDWHSSTECVAEYLTAVNLGKRVFCARLEPTTDPDKTREWQRCDLFGDGPATEIRVDGHPEPVRFGAEGLRRLLAGLGEAGIGAENFSWPPPDEPGRSPYRGWQPLDPVDAAVYFGRDAQIMQGMDRLRGMRSDGAESVFAVVGPSGAGKSSFLRAGLLPRLLREDRQFLVLDLVRPEQHALTGVHGLGAAIRATRARLGLTAPALGDIKSALPDDIERIRGWLIEMQHAARDRLLAPAGVAPTLLLPIDQAEELFVATAGVEGEQFLTLLGRLLAAPEDDDAQRLSMIVALTIRTDRYEQLQNTPQLDGVHTYVFNELKPLPRTQFKEVITGPAARADKQAALTIEPPLVDRLLADGDHGADTLPLLALTLSRLYDNFASSGTLTLEQYTALGGFDRVVQTEIDALLSVDPATRQSQLELLRSAFVPAMATINPDNDQPMRRIARWDELPDESRTLIDAFVNKRLLVKDHRDGHIVVEVALESLLRQWNELAGWLREQADDLKAADRLEHAAHAWDHNERDDAWLWEGTRLTEAETLSGKPEFRRRLAPTRDFLLASRGREDDRVAALRRRARTLAALLVVAVVVAVLAGVGFWRANIASDRADARARDATALRLIAESAAMLGGARPDGDIRAFQQLLAAHALTSQPQADTAVLDALYARHHLRTIAEANSDVSAVAFSSDGKRVVSGGNEGTIQLWDAATRHRVVPPSGVGAVKSLAFSPDGQRVVSGNSDGTIRLWDTATGKQIGAPWIGHTSEVWALAFRPDGRQVVSGSKDSSLRLWDAAAGTQIGAPWTGHAGWVRAVAFSPDGRRVVSGSNDSTIRLWDVATGQQVGPSMTESVGVVLTVNFSPDGTRVVSGSADRSIRLWNATTGMPIGDPWVGHTDEVRSVAFSPDGKRVVSGSYDGSVRLWDTGTGQPIGAPWTGLICVFSVAFSPDGKKIVSGGGDRAIRLWDAETGQPIGTPWVTSSVYSVAFSPDGQQIVSTGGAGMVRLWDAATGKPIGAPWRDQYGDGSGVAFSPDGRWVASTADDSTVKIWPILSASTKALCSKLTSNMSRKHWRDWISPDIDYIELCPGLPISPDR
ncbi:TIR domain-containing protein [Nocardia pseudovaccinii]|uniref:nSTAND1 domain-containing NTPase n=1 Tax=Nocardia pseudovaccinii TaxID=189540 RepID=UPI003D934E7E